MRVVCGRQVLVESAGGLIPGVIAAKGIHGRLQSREQVSIMIALRFPFPIHAYLTIKVKAERCLSRGGFYGKDSHASFSFAVVHFPRDTFLSTFNPAERAASRVSSA